MQYDLVKLKPMEPEANTDSAQDPVTYDLVKTELFDRSQKQKQKKKQIIMLNFRPRD